MSREILQSLIWDLVNLAGIIPEIASVALLLRNDWKLYFVFAREGVQIVAPLNVAIL